MSQSWIQGKSVPHGATVALIDMDGTATSCTDSINFTSTRAVFAELGITLDASTYALARGIGREEGIERLLRALGREDHLADVPRIAAKKNVEANRRRTALTRSDVPPADRAALDKLRALGLRLALGSSSRNAVDTLNRLQLIRCFDVIVTGNEMSGGITDKRGIWELALSYFSARAAEAIVIEDAQSGIDAAVGLGVSFSVGVGMGPIEATVRVQTLGDLDMYA
jgi:beta-phosphoglucomutase-like phosphatase (HAD superfamily)